MERHPIMVIALNLIFVSAVLLVAAIGLNLIVYSLIDCTFPHQSLAAAK